MKSATLNSHASGGVGFVKGGACGLVALYFLLCAAATQAQATYYVSETGNDRDDGLSPAAPWKSLSKVSRTRFQPGDTIKFKAGETFQGQLRVSSSGDADDALTYTRYGEGERPLLDAGNERRGAPVATILIEDQDHLIL